MHMFGGYGSGGFGMIFMLLFWIVIIGLLVWLFRQFFGKDSSAPQDSALEIARKRYAQGEIDKEEFEALKHELSKD